MAGPSAILDRLPKDLAAELASRRAEVTGSWDEGPRTYLYATSPEGRLFARTSSDPADASTMRHEAAVRAIVGDRGPLRAPAVVSEGSNWLLEAGMVAGDLWGPEAMETVIAAALKVLDLTLPELEVAVPPREVKRRRFSGDPVALGAAILSKNRYSRRLALLGTGLRIRDLIAAKRILAAPALPEATSHGDFHIGNVFYLDEALWVVDWEMAGRRPVGYDLMQFWASIERAEDRAVLFERTVELIGPEHRRALARLRYALLVRTIANKLGATTEFNRDETGGKALLKLLPEVRAAAR